MRYAVQVVATLRVPDLIASGTGRLHSVRTGREAYTEVHGHTFWADLDADPARQRYADGPMAAQTGAPPW